MYEDWYQRSQQQKTRLWKRLIPAYAGLPELEKQMLRLVAIAYEPLTRKALGAMLTEAGVQNPSGGAWTPAALKPYCDRLLAEELLVPVTGKGTGCQIAIAEAIVRDAVAAGEFKRLSTVVRRVKPIHHRFGEAGPYQFANKDQFAREVRIALYQGDWEAIEQYDRDYERQNSYRSKPLGATEIVTWVCTNPFDRDWFAALPAKIYDTAIVEILDDSLWFLQSAEEVFAQLVAGVEAGMPEPSNQTIALLVEQCLLRGRIEEAATHLKAFGKGRHERSLYRGWLAFLQGENSTAIARFQEALTQRRKEVGKRKNVFFSSIGGLFYILALLKDGSPQRLKEAMSLLDSLRDSHHWLAPCYSILAVVTEYCQSGNPHLQQIARLYVAPDAGEKSGIEFLIQGLCVYWLDKTIAQQEWSAPLEEVYVKAEHAEYYGLAEQLGDLMIRVRLGDRQDEASAELRAELVDAMDLGAIVRVREPWEMALDALIELQSQTKEPAAAAPAEKRLAWLLTWYSNRNWLLQPREQKVTASGEWSKGRPVALKRLYKSPEEFDYLSEQDRQICAQIRGYSSGSYYGGTDYRLAPSALKFLVGHPYVFWEDTAARVEVVGGEPELRVKQGKSQRLTIELVPNLADGKDFVPIRETPTRLKIVTITAEHRRISSVLGDKNKLQVPAAAKDRVLQAIAAVSGIVAVQSDIGGVSNLREVPAESKPHFQILPAGDGLKVSARVRPFASEGPYFIPGKGSETAIAEVGGERVQTHRDRREETQRLARALSACPVLAAQEEEGGEWLAIDPEACLEILLELQDLGDSAAVEWPEGEKLRVSHRASTSNFQLSLARKRDWFAVDGQLQLEDDRVLDMQQLLALLAETPGRFLPLGDGQYLALTRTFRKRLEELQAFASKRGRSLGVHPLAAPALQDFAEEVGELKADKHWQAQVQRLREMEELQPQVPSTLQAELRDYQGEGFGWLARLAYWGVGACLADDMGLGKTLQALALMLTRAPEGPTLVVAPTSVCGNWEAEAQKFAPTLNPIIFGTGDRQQVLDRLQPFDVLICSYGLLQQEDVAAMLAGVEWETVVLDEAQAIKNSATKRSRAAMALQAGFKLILTGTPIENHLGELWNLFQFINPGLLGSLERFNQHFAIPIERDKDKPARDRLKKLVQPFLLRRRKSEVLEELPSRTEISLQVELSGEEMAFYESLRRDALAKLSDRDAAAGERHLQVLAEIMRLRRACCHPRLIDANLALPSAKLECFGEVLAELLENGHKALVFSQFVDHLQIVREYLDGEQVAYQYLDGSTRAGDRRKRVSAFQAGESDVFLISLKAGGTGLNLTAADYVIHLDPWWNPAVEDQASDRAHRIGQQRPVTIYRLVAAGTIEEKIIDLHRHKRDLADSLLAGTDAGVKLSTDDLLALMGT